MEIILDLAESGRDSCFLKNTMVCLFTCKVVGLLFFPLAQTAHFYAVAGIHSVIRYSVVRWSVSVLHIDATPSLGNKVKGVEVGAAKRTRLEAHVKTLFRR